MASSELLVTLGNEEQISKAFNGDFLRGHRQPRIAMVGRSNVGKSSLINALIGGRLARASSQPGKTRLLHFYSWPDAGLIVADLPGYGYASASHEDRDKWSQLIRSYFEWDRNLALALVLLDARHGPTKIDEEAIEFLDSLHVPLGFVFTKSDTLKNQSETARRKKEAVAKLTPWVENPQDLLWVSTTTKTGIKPLQVRLKEMGAG